MSQTAERTSGGGVLTSKGQATRARIIDAAEKVFGELSFDQASVSEVTRRAGVAQGTFYLYFPSKKAVYGELVRRLGKDIRQRISGKISGLDSRIEIERAGFTAFFDYVREHPALYRIVRQAEFVDRQAFREYYEVFADGYKQGLIKAKSQGEISSLDPEVLAWCLMGMGDLVGVRWILLQEGGRVPDEVIDTMIRFISKGFEG